MIAGTSPPALSKSMFTDSTCVPPEKLNAKKQKTRWAYCASGADECFVLRNSMHTSSGAAYGRDDDGGDAPESS
jgi:hypothetical protein